MKADAIASPSSSVTASAPIDATRTPVRTDTPSAAIAASSRLRARGPVPVGASDASSTVTRRPGAPRSAWAIAIASSWPATPPPITATRGGRSPRATAASKARQRTANPPSGLAATPCAPNPSIPGISEVMPTSSEATS